jgi:hypothetical protein
MDLSDTQAGDVAERARIAIFTLYGSENRAASVLGWAQSSLHRLLNEEGAFLTRTGKRNLVRLVDDIASHGGWSRDYLLTGEGPVEGVEDPAIAGSSTSNYLVTSRPVQGEPDELIPIPLVDINVSSRSGSSDMDVEIVPIATGDHLPASQIRMDYGIAPQRLVLVKVRGEGMNGPPANLAPGNLLKGAILDPGVHIAHGAIYVVVGPQGMMLKRIYFDEQSQGDGEPVRRVCLWSDNPEAGRTWVSLDTWKRDYRPIVVALRKESDL